MRVGTKTMEESIDYVLQGILILSTDTLKEAFFHLKVNISDLPDLKKCTAEVYITGRWGKPIIKQGPMTVLNP